ncbi:UDP-glucose 4-epimerase GalE [Philodulcilactobacillus myokoensis]|uniref:UDP-glucose 4-epimerase n=1 Tax=Philodulcilactobacillus myokoensis TaxID=2929573 RepID=A0A9W6B0Y9_9LACO|nr:UDP-glucose 4-epimerase GalE [Philodulcilactobacillus myokoensis]GLB46485.1 UDP-glucose 4-epimerase GalE [Philodulcilactobacillus myokoensis]
MAEQNKNVLVAGGAGYIGSHMVKKLLDEGYHVVVLDNLSTGHKKAIDQRAKFYEGDTRDKAFLDRVFQNEDINTVIHMDAFSIVPESMKNPLKYFDNNVIGMIKLLESMVDNHVPNIVFSSTAATFGNPKGNRKITEKDPQNPINPYGESKLIMEKIMKWVSKANHLHYVALRYFNASGADASGKIGEDHHPETHLIPIVMQTAYGQRKNLQIFGDDYDTPDGTNVRDYIHINDLADAHILAMKYLNEGHKSDSFNLGSSKGFSVKQIVDTSRDVTGKPIQANDAPRRPGDPDTLVADSTKAKKVLHWKPKYGIHDIVKTAWNWKEKHPEGYQKY